MDSVTADHSEDTNWGDDDPSVFVINSVAHLQGQYQLCNGYGIRKARQVLRVRDNTALMSASTCSKFIYLNLSSLTSWTCIRCRTLCFINWSAWSGCSVYPLETLLFRKNNIWRLVQRKNIIWMQYPLWTFLFVLQDHWRTFITESDFSFIASSGLNAVRIPVGWWIASDPRPPRPFVGGSLRALDNAFRWAE